VLAPGPVLAVLRVLSAVLLALVQLELAALLPRRAAHQAQRTALVAPRQ
jgi:hypothetical protein